MPASSATSRSRPRNTASCAWSYGSSPRYGQPVQRRPGLRGAGRLRLPLTGALLDDREFLADHADIRRLPPDLQAGGPEFGVLAAQAVLDLSGRASQVGQHEGHVAELRAQRLERGEHLVLGVGVAGLDRGAEHRAAGVDLAHHHRDVGSQLTGALVAGGEGRPDATEDLPLQGPAQVRLSAQAVLILGHLSRTGPALRLLEQACQGVGPDRGEHAQAAYADRGLAVRARPGESGPEGRRAQQRQHTGAAAVT